MRYSTVLSVAALTFVAACGTESPTEASRIAAPSGSIVITEGAPTPARAPRPLRSAVAAEIPASLGGSSTTPLSLTSQSCSATASQQVVITYTITGRQANPASFKVNTVWAYDGSAWTGSAPTTISVDPQAAGPVGTTKQVTLTVSNASATGSGLSSFTISVFDLVTSAPAALGVGAAATVTVHVAFAACAVTNTAPTLVLPNDMVVEATSSAGAAVPFTVTANDNEDGDLTSHVTCSPASGDIFPLGTTTVNCEVTDAGGLTTTGSFQVTVHDTTPAFFTSFPTGTINLVAANINGATLDVGSLGITAEDVGHVSEPSTVSCDYVDGTVLAIGSTTTVSCTATDHIGNQSAPSTFDVFVGLNVSGSGFLTPLRMTAPFSVHKRGSTIPHKFLPPTYADGMPATDLSGDLRLVINQLDGTTEGADIEVDDYSAGSTLWRYDADAGQYIFNLKTITAWSIGTWKTTVSYKGITLATTTFDLK